jgi:hypothetical protein
MRTVIAVLSIAVFVSIAHVRAENACRGSDAKFYNEALAYHLEKRGVPHRLSDSVVCVSDQNAPELRAAMAQVDASFYQVAHLLTDACEERAFVEWAKRERLRFDVRSTVDSQGEPSGRMFHLRSFTPDEVASNRTKMTNGAPKRATCNANK